MTWYIIGPETTAATVTASASAIVTTGFCYNIQRVFERARDLVDDFQRSVKKARAPLPFLRHNVEHVMRSGLEAIVLVGEIVRPRPRLGEDRGGRALVHRGGFRNFHK